MSKFNLYIIKEITFSFVYLFILLTGILWLGQGLRHIELLTTDNISLASYISYVALLIPKITSITVPVSTFLAVVFNLNRIRSDSELVILWASGESNRTILLKPIMLISIFIFFIMTNLSLFITPYALNEVRQKIIEIRSSGLNSSILQEKKFISPTDRLTIFIQELNGNKIENLLIHDLSQDDKPQTYIAQSGEFISDDQNKFLRLFNGTTQILDKNEKRISEISFETYDLDLNPFNKSESNHRYADELLSIEIIKNLKNSNMKNYNWYEQQQFAEINNRFISPLYLFCYAFLPIIIFIIANKPNDSWMFPISIISFLAILIKVIEISLSNILIENNNLIYLCYIVPLLLISLILVIIFYDKILLINKNYAVKT